jgi:hypothetical protein
MNPKRPAQRALSGPGQAGFAESGGVGRNWSAREPSAKAKRGARSREQKGFGPDRIRARLAGDLRFTDHRVARREITARTRFKRAAALIEFLRGSRAILSFSGDGV